MAPPSRAQKVPPPTTKRPLRRPVVDTNTLSYDRTDPFSAINALRKLITSLASRIGGCQYRFTPDEHKLSVHLLTIIEPFVGLSPSRRALTRQPTEILDAIVFHVDSKRDLLSLALSCRRLHSVIFPRHYDYRVLCAKASSISLWNHLIVNRALARNVRSIEIIDERSPKALVLPSDILKTDTDVESSDDELALYSKQEKLLLSALNKTAYLRSFHWSCNHSTISIDSLWATLTKCGTLSQVTISDNLVFLPYAPDKAKPVNAKVLPELKSIALQATKHTFGSTKTPALARVSGMLSSCPNLESLDIGYEHRRVQGQRLPLADDFFLCSRWPALRSLSLANLRCSSSHSLQSASVFFAAHANLEVLHLDLPLDRPTSTTGTSVGTTSTLVLPPNALPNLRELKCGKLVATAILNCPTDTPRPLETLKGIALSGSDWDRPFLASLKRCGSSVRRMELAGWNDLDDIKRLVECVPKLTWLDVNKHKRTPESQEQRAAPGQGHGTRRNDVSMGRAPAAPSAGQGVATNVMEWATVLAPLAELTTFVGVKFFYEVSALTLTSLASCPSTSLSASELSRVRKNDKVAGLLANKCLKLRRLDHWEDAGGRVIVLSRDGNEVKWEVKRLRV